MRHLVHLSRFIVLLCSGAVLAASSLHHRGVDRKGAQLDSELVVLAGSMLLVVGGLVWRTRVLGRRNVTLGTMKAEREIALLAAEASREHLRRLSLRLQDAKEEERKHLARELHDEFGQALTAVKLNLALAQAEHDCDRLGESIAEIDRLIDQVRALSVTLRPPQIDELGLVPALENHLRAVARHSGTEIVFLSSTTLPSLGIDRDLVVFRVAQEAVTNALRHAEPLVIEVRLEAQANRTFVEVRDYGRGFDADAALRIGGAGHFGLFGMQERVRDLGGRLHVLSRPGAGTVVSAELPSYLMKEAVD